MKEHGELNKIVSVSREYRDTLAQLDDTKELLKDSDPEMQSMAKEEAASLKEIIKKHESEIKVLLMPKDPNDNNNIYLEIRAGTGGDEAALFAGDLFTIFFFWEIIS